jgi:8-oxo-dGTP diphosphatase
MPLKPGVDYIGVTCVFFCHDGQGRILLHKRSKNCRDEQGRWDNGGGKLEFGERNFENAVRREVKEEYCVEPQEIKFLTATNVLRKNGNEDTHWVALIFAVKVDPTLVKIGEPHKMDDLSWFTADTLPSPLHSQMLRHLEHVKEVGLV